MGLVCLTAIFGNLLDAMTDYQAVVAAGDNPARRLYARTIIRRERVRILLQAVFFATGVYALLTPAPVRQQVNAWAVALAGAVILAEVALLYDSVRDRFDKRRLEWLIANDPEFTAPPSPLPPLAVGDSTLDTFDIPRTSALQLDYTLDAAQAGAPLPPVPLLHPDAVEPTPPAPYEEEDPYAD